MQTPTILVADPNAKFLEKAEEILRDAGFRTVRVTDGAAAREVAESQDLTGILAHMDLPGCSGAELCRYVKTRSARPVPVVLMSPEDPEGVALADAAGADNILFRPVKKAELLFCARTMTKLRDAQRRTAAGSIDEGGAKGSRLSHFEFFKAFLTVEVKRARRYGFPLSVMLASLDDMDAIGARYGKPVLRQLLSGLARAIRRSVRDIDIPVTLRDDTILVLMPHTDGDGAAVVADRVRQRIRRSVYREGELVIRPTISIGETTYDRQRDRNFSQVVRRASKAMREAVRKGGDQVVVL
jgi:diguanylate cyclase (GGDEF)-like protein